MTGCPANNSPIARALGDDFINLHTAVRKHYSEPTVVLSGVMDSINVKTAIRPVALLSYMLFRAPVPHGGEDVEFTVHSFRPRRASGAQPSPPTGRVAGDM